MLDRQFYLSGISTMVREKSIGQRVTVFQEFKAIRIHIKSSKQVSLLLFVPIWIGWTVAGIVVIRGLLSGEAPLSVLLWLCGWLVAETLVVYTGLWTAFGKEIISIEGGILTVKRDILGYGPSKEMPIYQLRNLRASGYFGPIFSWNHTLAQWGLSGGTIAVDEMDKTYRFGINLQEKEAKAVVKELQPYLAKSEPIA
jgi:hypothetical protein